MEIEIIKLRCGLRDPKGKLIPRGVAETLNAEIADEVATFWFRDPRTTERFARTAMALEKRRGANDTVWMERVKKAATKYPEKTKEEIRDIILNQLKQMGVNVKNVSR